MFSLARSVLIDRAFSEVAVDIGSIVESRAPRDTRAPVTQCFLRASAASALKGNAVPCVRD
jgi:hypothetical protein